MHPGRELASCNASYWARDVDRSRGVRECMEALSLLLRPAKAARAARSAKFAAEIGAGVVQTIWRNPRVRSVGEEMEDAVEPTKWGQRDERG
jgi:hypothetical protein